MTGQKSFRKSVLVGLIAFSLLLPGSLPVRANDLVPSADLTGGASVFVFRGSSKRPQERAAFSGGARSAAGMAGNRARLNSQAAARRKSRAELAKARATQLARARARERNRLARQSNVLTARGEKQLEEGTIDPAINSFREAIKLNAKNSEAKIGLSEGLTAKATEQMAAGDDLAALPLLEEAALLDPQNQVAYLKLGELHDTRNNNGEAITNYAKALEIDPELTAVYLPLGLLYAETGDDARADEMIAKAETAGTATTEAKFARAAILKRKGNEEEAMALYRSVTVEEPNNGTAFYAIARLHDEAGRGDQAVAAYQDALKAEPTLSVAWFDLGVLQYNRGEYDEAANSYLKVLDLDPANASAHAHLASAYRQLERFADANVQYRAAYEKGITKDAELLSEWGFCLGKTNEWDKASARLKSAEELNPTAVDHNNVGWAYYNAARYDKQNNKEDEAKQKLELARQSLQRAVEMDANLHPAFMNLGATNNELGDFQAATEALNRALSLQGDWVIAMNQLGRAYRGAGDLQNAIAQFSRVSTLDANNVFGLYNLGEVYHLTGNKREARRVRDRLKRIDPVFSRKLEDVLSGKVVLDEARRNIRNKVPRLPGIPF